MRSIEGVGDFDSVLQRLLDQQRPLLQPFGKRLPRQVFHDEEIDVALVADVVKHANVGMIQRSDGSRFTFEPLSRGRIRGET
jgi:hypothetical protein